MSRDRSFAAGIHIYFGGVGEVFFFCIGDALLFFFLTTEFLKYIKLTAGRSGAKRKCCTLSTPR